MKPAKHGRPRVKTISGRQVRLGNYTRCASLLKPIPNYEPRKIGKYIDCYDKYVQLGVISGEEMRKYHLANLNCLDDNIGRLLNAVDRLKLTGSTLIVFFSDNGGTPHGGGESTAAKEVSVCRS